MPPEFLIRFLSSEAPHNVSVVGVASLLPSLNFGSQGFAIINALIRTRRA